MSTRASAGSSSFRSIGGSGESSTDFVPRRRENCMGYAGT